MTVEFVDFNFDAALDEHVELADGLSDRELAERIVDDMPLEAMREFVIEGVKKAVIQKRRKRFNALADGRKQGSSRWAQAAELAWEVKILRAEVAVGSRRKPFGDCTLVDCVALARERKTLATTAMRHAEQFAKCAVYMKQHKLTAVREIPVLKLKEFFEVKETSDA